MYALVATRTDGETLTAAKYNADLQNHIDNQELQKTDDFSATVTQMQTNTDPGEAGTESLATDASGELARLRFAVKETKDALGTTVAQWYTTPATISGLVATQGTHNLAISGDFEDWRDGTAVAPFGWTLTGAGAAVARDGTNFKTRSFAASVTRAGADAVLERNAIAEAGGQAHIRSRAYRFSAWVRATVASRVRLRINDGIGSTFSTYHTGGGAFERLSIARTLDSLATALKVGLSVDTGDTNGQIDLAMLSEGTAEVAFAPRPEDLDLAVPADPHTRFEFLEDFASPTSVLAGGAGSSNAFLHGWRATGTPTYIAGPSGLFRIVGDGTNNVFCHLEDRHTNNFALIVRPAKLPNLKMSFAQRGNGTATRRIGLMGTVVSTTDPANGIYIRHALNGNLIAVARASSVETILDTGVAAAEGTFHEVTLQMTDTAKVRVLVNGVDKGEITSNVPTVDLGPLFAAGGSATDMGIEVDYIHFVQGR